MRFKSTHNKNIKNLIYNRFKVLLFSSIYINAILSPIQNFLNLVIYAIRIDELIEFN